MLDNVVLDPPCGPYVYEDVLNVTCKTGYELSDASNAYLCVCLDTGMLNCTESCTSESVVLFILLIYGLHATISFTK